MKKTLCIVLALVLSFALFAACGGNSGNTAAPPPPAAAPTQSQPSNSGTQPPPAAAEGWDFSDATKVNLAFALYMPEGDPTVIAACNFLETIKEYTEGTVDYTLHASATLCAADEQLDAVKSGLADIAMNASAYFAGSLPLTYMLEYPGVQYANDRATAFAMNEWHQTLKLAELEDFYLLYGYGQGSGALHTTVPIRTVEDFKGVQMRTSAALIPVLEAYGFIPTALSMGEVYEAMRTGVVQGATAMIPAAFTFNLFEVQKYCTIDPFYVSSYVMTLNKDVWNSLTPDQQEAVKAATEFGFAEYIASGRQGEVPECLAFFEEKGVEVIYMSDEEIAKMGALNAPLQSNYAASVPGGTEALALLRELAAKYNAIYPEYF